MLTRLLELLREGGTRHVSELADELETTPKLVETMLEDLAEMGYIKSATAHCSGRCAYCPASPTCAAGGSLSSEGQIWVLVEDR